MTEDEVQRVSEALEAVERIADPEERVRAKSKIMAEQVRRNPTWAKERKELIHRLHHEDGLSYRQIAARLEITLSTVQSAFRDYTGSGTHRPKKAAPEGND